VFKDLICQSDKMPMSVHSLLGRNRPPPLFYPALYLFNLFPLHAPLTLWGLDAPYGRFGAGEKATGVSRWLYLNGTLYTSATCKQGEIK
jgi:hypothetical protein